MMKTSRGGCSGFPCARQLVHVIRQPGRQIGHRQALAALHQVQRGQRFLTAPIGGRRHCLQRFRDRGPDEQEILALFGPGSPRPPLDLGPERVVQAPLDQRKLQAGHGEAFAQAAAHQVATVHDLADAVVLVGQVLLGLDLEGDHPAVQQPRPMQQPLDLRPMRTAGQPCRKQLTGRLSAHGAILKQVAQHLGKVGLAGAEET